MRKIFLSALITAVSLVSHSQTKETAVSICFNGKLFHWQGKKLIYYTMNDEPFSSKRTIKADTASRYKLDLSKTVYKNLSSGQLVFAVDSTSSPTDEFSCTHRFNIGEINSFARSAGKKKIDFYSDLIPEYNCITTVVFRAEGREAELVGDYTLQNGDTTYSIKLHQNLYRYSATFSPMSDRFTNLENGSWNFNSEENILRIHTENRLHSAMGIMIVLRKTRAFKVIKTGNRLEFESFDGSTLTKMN